MWKKNSLKHPNPYEINVVLELVNKSGQLSKQLFLTKPVKLRCRPTKTHSKKQLQESAQWRGLRRQLRLCVYQSFLFSQGHHTTWSLYNLPDRMNGQVSTAPLEGRQLAPSAALKASRWSWKPQSSSLHCLYFTTGENQNLFCSFPFH